MTHGQVAGPTAKMANRLFDSCGMGSLTVQRMITVGEMVGDGGGGDKRGQRVRTDESQKGLRGEETLRVKNAGSVHGAKSLVPRPSYTSNPKLSQRQL